MIVIIYLAILVQFSLPIIEHLKQTIIE